MISVEKSRNYKPLLSFVSGVATASIAWLLFYHPSEELPIRLTASPMPGPTHETVKIMPGALEDSLLLLPRGAPPSTVSQTSLLKTPGKPSAPAAAEKSTQSEAPTESLVHETIENPPVSEGIEELPMAGPIGDLPVPGSIEELPVLGVVKDPPEPKMAEESPIPN